MKIKLALKINEVIAKNQKNGRLVKNKKYKVIYPATYGTKYIFVLDETNNVNGYHIRNFK